MRVAVLTPFYLPAYRGGGPIRTLAAMVAEHGDRHDFLVLAPDTDLGERTPMPVPTGRWTRVGKAFVWYHRAGLPGLLDGLGQIRRQRPDVLYLNSLLHPAYAILPLVLARLGYFGDARVLLAPRGELGGGALALKAGKKRAFLAAARALRLPEGITWHASSRSEAAEIDAAFPGARVVVRENEVLLPGHAVRPPAPAGVLEALDAETLGAAEAAGGKPLRVVFLSRLAAKKGLDVLLRALARVRGPVRLDVYGDGDPAYVAHCRARVEALGDHVTVRFHGTVPPDRVAAAFTEADVFAFPTAHENFGHVIAESLAASCPVLLADVTPWSEVVRAGGGEIVPSLVPGTWAAALTRYARRSPRERYAARLAAGEAYDAWQGRRPRVCVVDLAFGEIGPGRTWDR